MDSVNLDLCIFFIKGCFIEVLVRQNYLSLDNYKLNILELNSYQ